MNLASLGYLSATYGLAVSLIQEAIERLGLQPDLTLNGVAYYGETGQGRLCAELVNSRALERVGIRFPPVPVTFEDDDE